MLEKLMKVVFGDPNAKELKVCQNYVNKINALEPEMAGLSDARLCAKTSEFRLRLSKGETLDDLLPEAFAVVREAAKRVMGMRHFDVQLIGGCILHRGNIAEMRTGEGKTLVATLPAYLNALEGKGVHVVTVNDYLARRDSEDMGRVFRFLGLSVGLIIHDMDFPARKAAYAADITYGTNNEFGFDYLRDNMVVSEDQMVQRPLHYAIVDEVDSILIDEARTPLIISGPGEKSTDLYNVMASVVANMKKDVDYTVDEKQKTVAPTEVGIAKAEKMLGVQNMYAGENGVDLSHQLMAALKAKALMFRDRDYVVKDGEVIIVDEFTGRLMYGRRFSEGLHQAIEAKEHVKVERESQTLATITFQNYFRMYDKLSGMTGTAKTEEQEFQKIYGLSVYVVPTNKPNIRIDYPDVIYKTKKAKYRAVVKAIEELHAKGRPVLVGTTSIQQSEELSDMLKKKGIQHNVLNAKYHEKEAEIVADAGQMGAVTIATNMAGRGTDIKLDEETKALGGLKIIGTERHESRRIDNQLRGRSGRQGDPGESRFYLSLEDDLLRLFGSDRLMAMFEAMGVPEGEQIEHKMLSNAIEKAQMKIESNNYGIREQLLKFDEVNNEQREVIYAERRKVLDGDNMRDLVLKMITDTVENAVDISVSDDQTPDKWDLQELNNLLLPVIPLKPVTLSDEQKKSMKKNELKHNLKEEAIKLYETKEAEFPEPEQIREIERVVLLKVIDNKWMAHLDDMDALREGIGLQAYGQRDPVVEYKMQGYEMYESMMASIQEETIRILFHIRVEQKVEREPAAKVTGTNKDASAPSAPKKRAEQKIYPNDPCPCGSGKKYKQCHGRIK